MDIKCYKFNTLVGSLVRILVWDGEKNELTLKGGVLLVLPYWHENHK